MPLVNSSDLLFDIVKEAVYGTTPTTGATRHELPVSVDQAPIAAVATELTSNTRRPGRAGNGMRYGMKMVDGSLDIRFQRHAFMDILLESALSGTFASDVLKASDKDSSFSILQTVVKGTAGNAAVKAISGCQVSGFSIKAKGNDNVTSTFEIMGAKETNLTTDNPLVRALVTGTTEFVGSEVATINVGGVALQVVEFEIAGKLPLTRRPYLSSNDSLGFGVNGAREVTITVKAYHDGTFALEDAITGAPQVVSLDIGGEDTGYRIEAPAAMGILPKTTIGEGSVFKEITFKLKYDETAGTDLIVTRL